MMRSTPLTRRPSVTPTSVSARPSWTWPPPLERVPYLCECDDVDCRELIPLTAPEYERIREDGATFGVLRGHSGDGDVIEEHDDYLVVRKPGRGGEVARALDPRREEADERRAG